MMGRRSHATAVVRLAQVALAALILIAAQRLLPGWLGGARVVPESVVAATLLETNVGATLLSYQGRITSPATGQPLADGAYGVNFFIFDAATGGSQLWTEARSVQQTRGLFVALLGEVTPLPLNIFDGRDLWLQLQVNGETLDARQRIAWVAYAINARKAETALIANTVADNAITSAKIADGAITSADIADGQVFSADIADGTIGPADLSPAAQNKFINFNVFSAILAGSATFTSGFGPNAGITMPENATSSSFALNFTLPPNYTEGTTLNGSIVWVPTSGSCNIHFQANYISVARPSVGYLQGPGAADGLDHAGTTNNNTLAAGNANQPRTLAFTITNPNPTMPLRAGDAISFGFFRNSTFSQDTCAGTTAMRIQGISITYQ